MNKLTTTQRREVRGIVYAVQYTNIAGDLITPSDEEVVRDFEREGWDVQSVKLGIDGYFIVEVLL